MIGTGRVFRITYSCKQVNRLSKGIIYPGKVSCKQLFTDYLTWEFNRLRADGLPVRDYRLPWTPVIQEPPVRSLEKQKNGEKL